jgi:hypothetical protein
MAVCVGYLEANAHHTPDTLTVIGLVSPKARWQAFEERWPHALHAERLTAFSGRDFIQQTGEFMQGWPGDRRARLVAALSRVASESAILGVSYSLRLADYKAAARKFLLAEGPPSPYAVCAGVAMSRILRWMMRARAEDVTLCVFEDGGIDHHQVRQVAAAEGIDHGEPVQIWPREWRDERDRRRLLRPLEACDLLMPGCGADLTDRLMRRSAWDQEQLDRDRLVQIFDSLTETEPAADRV